ncbi:MAG: orotidine-5'-phosphate decarboxylase [Candidatus Omnitrophica bacterium]|nr:orotidine-5'-phosphate decarboxylase [Candidatus Omnitrophota bacterium]
MRWNKLIVALDLKKRSEIDKVIKALAPKGVKFKIGSIAFTKFGPQLVKRIIERKIDVFLDLKLYDIPNTMSQTAGLIAEMGCWAFTVHIKAGSEALSAVREEVNRQPHTRGKPLILGVTELTSKASNEMQVLELAACAQGCRLDGVIASSQEAAAIKAKFPRLLVITPGIRSPQDEKGDQRRVTTANTAFNQGADYIVVGRPIVAKRDYLKAAQEVLSA